MTMAIDTKVKMLAINPCNGKVYTENNAVLFSARDKCLLPALNTYRQACKDNGADGLQIEAIDALISRVETFQEANGTKIPDIDSNCEADMTLNTTDMDDNEALLKRMGILGKYVG